VARRGALPARINSEDHHVPRLVYSRSEHRRELSESSDRELLAALARDDEEAFDELMRRKGPLLLGLATRMVSNREEARDIVQLTFLRAWEHRRRFDEKWSPNTWLYRIATNLAIDYLRAAGGRRDKAEPVRRHLLEAVRRRREPDLMDLDHREVETILRELAEGLSERQRAVFLLREVEGLSSAEVGEILGCRGSTVRNHLFAARKHLRQELRARYPEYGALGPGGDE
jgi:RNA polymerase sigma-70 factor (ECF subfamily)